MKKCVLWTFGIAVLFFTAVSVFALEQEVNAPSQGKVAVTNPPAQEPNRQTDLDRQQMLRRQARERIIDRARQQRAGEDLNVPPGARGPNMPAQRPIAPSQGQLKEIEQQISAEQATHRERIARLDRIRQLAQQQGNAEVLGKVDNILKQENQVYSAKSQRLEHRKNRVIEFSGKNKPPGAADANKNVNQPPRK